LVAFDRQQIVGPFVEEDLGHGLVLGVHRVQAHPLAGQNRGAGDQSLGGGNFVALVGHRLDSQAPVRRQADRPG